MSINPKNGVLFDLTQAVPSFPTFKKIVLHLQEQLLSDENSFYTDVAGELALRLQIAKNHPLKSSLKADDLIITAGANHAAYTAFTLHFDIGDTVLLPEPCYFNHDMALKMLGLKSHFYKMSPQMNFQLAADEMIIELKASKARGVVLVTPNNPTGVIYNSGEVFKLLNWTSKNNVSVILDETYMRFDPNHLSLDSIYQFIGNGLSLVGSFSKTLSLTGYRVGYLIHGSKHLENVLKIQDTMVICAPVLSQKAALFGLQFCENEVQMQIELIFEKERLLKEMATHWKNFKLCSSGAYFAFIKHPFDDLTAEQAALKIFHETGLLTLPGTVFGPSQSSFLRLAFANIDKIQLRRALKNLSDFDKLLTL